MRFLLVLSIMTGLLAFGHSAKAEVVSHRALVLAVSEGTSGGIDNETALKKYKALADVVGKALQTKVSIVFVREFAQLEEGMQKQQFDIVMARPSDYPARGVRDYGYHFIATAEPAGHCELIVAKGSPLQSVKDLNGRYFIFPEKQAYMTRFCRAALRDEGIVPDDAHVFYVREQGVIPFSLKNGIADVGGVASYSGAYTKWLASGQRVLYESRAQPYFPVIASPSLNEMQRKQVQDALTGMSSTSVGQNELGLLSIKGFVTTEQDRFNKLLNWLAID